MYNIRRGEEGVTTYTTTVRQVYCNCCTIIKRLFQNIPKYCLVTIKLLCDRCHPLHPNIDRFHAPSRWPCWWTRTINFLSIFMQILHKHFVLFDPCHVSENHLLYLRKAPLYWMPLNMSKLSNCQCLG